MGEFGGSSEDSVIQKPQVEGFCSCDLNKKEGRQYISKKCHSVVAALVARSNAAGCGHPALREQRSIVQGVVP